MDTYDNPIFKISAKLEHDVLDVEFTYKYDNSYYQNYITLDDLPLSISKLYKLSFIRYILINLFKSGNWIYVINGGYLIIIFNFAEINFTIPLKLRDTIVSPRKRFKV